MAKYPVRVGVLGGGQLGRMLVEAANRDVRLSTLTLDAAGCPAAQITERGHLAGSFKKAADIRRLAERADVLTVEIEHVDTQVLEELADRVEVQPHWRTVRTIQDKLRQKELLQSRGVALGPFIGVESRTEAAVNSAATQLGGFPIVLKARTGAYDGRGNYVVRSKDDVPAALEFLGDRPLYGEKMVNFAMELAVMVVKIDAAATSDAGAEAAATLAYPAVETVHRDSICQLTYCPPRGVSAESAEKARALARKAVAAFEGRGIFGVEMFLVRDGNSDILLVNEIAPRPHNSGHWTLSAARISQFSAHLAAITQQPVHAEDLQATQPSIMLNILGGASPDAHLTLVDAARAVPGTDVYDYGKGAGTPGRKMGHLVVTASDMATAEERMGRLLELAEQIRATARSALKRSNADAITATATPAVQPSQTQSTPRIPQLPPGSRHGRIAVTMGSHSDLPVLRPGLEYLAGLGLEPFVTITSAHRTPDAMSGFGKALATSGFCVAIAAAGGAAHLPGMLAAHTNLPVIGVPVKPSIGDGTDSLLSIANMPRGCAVACVGVNNSINAAQLAVRILAAFDAGIAEQFARITDDQRHAVELAATKLEHVGWRDFQP